MGKEGGDENQNKCKYDAVSLKPYSTLLYYQKKLSDYSNMCIWERTSLATNEVS